jgi:putative addiction module killer protein
MKDNSGHMRILQTEEFASWLANLADPVGKAHVASRIRRLERGHLGDWKRIDPRIWELRIHCGPGYRIYFALRPGWIALLLVGGQKSSQPRDIFTARDLLNRIGDPE